jgi:hypothetical protein
MDKYKVFTLGQNFPLDKVRDLVDDLHNKHQHYIVMVDPGKRTQYRHLNQSLTYSSRRCSGLRPIQQGSNQKRLLENQCRRALERRSLARDHRLPGLVCNKHA